VGTKTKRKPVPRSQLPPDVWHVKHAAAFLGLSVSAVYKMAADGTLPCSRPSGRLFFDPAKVESWAKGGPE
jgi:excisionase family DNA binding protein